MFFCVVLCIVCFVSFSALFVCICVLNYCHRVATQLQLNISYISFRVYSTYIVFRLLSYLTWSDFVQQNIHLRIEFGMKDKIIFYLIFRKLLRFCRHLWNISLMLTRDVLYCVYRMVADMVEIKGGSTLVTLPRIVTPYRDSVDGTRARVTYQKLVTR
jgi:hypothetical protein